MMPEDPLNYWLVVIVGYLYIDSWVTAFAFRKVYKRLEDLEG